MRAPTQESDEVYANAGEKGWKQTDPARPPRRRATKRKGHGIRANACPRSTGLSGRAGSQIRVRVLRPRTAAALRPLIEMTMPVGSLLLTSEWRGDAWVGARGRVQQAANPMPGQREWAGDDRRDQRVHRHDDRSFYP